MGLASAARAGRFLSVRAQDCLVIALLALGSRALMLVIAAAGHFGRSEDGRLGATDLASMFANWDAGWYRQIITIGYAIVPGELAAGTTAHAFFPLYPLTVRGVVTLTGADPVVAGIVVSTLLFVLALFVIRELVIDLGFSRETALATALLLSCAPHSFVFSSLYAESLFLFLLAAAMFALRRRYYLWAGVFAALLSGTRPNGVLFVVFAAIWAVRTLGWRAIARPWTEPGPMLAIVLAPLGLVAYSWFCFATTGDAFAQRTTMVHGWGWATEWPWANVARNIAGSSTDRFWAWGSLLYFGASLLLLRYRRYEEFAFCLASFLLVWTSVLPQSLVRYPLVLFPIFVALAHASRGRPLVLATLASGLAAVNGLLTVAFALQWHIAV